MIRFNLTSPLSDVSHIARGVEAQFKHLGVLTVKDLLFYFPSRYDDLSKITPISQARLGERVVLRGKVELMETQRSRFRKKLLTSAIVTDGTGTVRVIWFAQPWISKILKIGDGVYLVGELKDEGSGAYLSSPTYERVGKQETIHTGRIVPVYPSTEKLSQKQIRFLMRNVLPLARDIPDPLPPDITGHYKLLPLTQALPQVHFPQNEKQLEEARHRLKFDELLRLQLFSATLKRELKKVPAPVAAFQEEKTKQFVEGLPFKLTDAQRKAAWEIIGDLGRARPMNRLLEGDVGSGKTVVVAIVALNAVLGVPSPYPLPQGEGDRRAGEGRGQVAIMAPTEILARQHFGTFSKLLTPMGVSVGLCTGSEKIMHPELGIRNQELRDRKKHNSKFIIHNSDIIVGTQALIQDAIEFKNLVLAVIDEQHRFGVSQRAALKEKRTDGKMPHLLTLTATPIPRSLALVFYGDLDISILNEMPKGRQKIETVLVTERPSPVLTDILSRGERNISSIPSPQGRGEGEGVAWSREQAYAFIRKEVAAGHQVFWTCPIIDPSDILGVKAATEVFEHLKTEVFKDLKIGMLHGRMKSKERERVMEEFATTPRHPERSEGSHTVPFAQDEISRGVYPDRSVGARNDRRAGIDILVATPVIEVGIDVPNATVMVIEGSERFGLAQLHQFRGRVGRSEAKSYCLLMVDDLPPPPARSCLAEAGGLTPPRAGGEISSPFEGEVRRGPARLKAFIECDSGFDLAERDLALRGPGEMYGMAQSGFPEFKIASFADVEIAKEAKEAAQTLLEQDTELTRYPELKQAVMENNLTGLD